MIDSKELRIGNYIQRRSKEGIIEVDLELLSKVSRQSFLFDPIPLTEEWLKNFGYKHTEKGNYCNVTRYSINKIDNYNGYLLCDDYVLRNIEHVHTLQNAIFSLTGQELQLTKEEV